jgi:hypothetical protein
VVVVRVDDVAHDADRPDLPRRGVGAAHELVDRHVALTRLPVPVDRERAVAVVARRGVEAELEAPLAAHDPLLHVHLARCRLVEVRQAVLARKGTPRRSDQEKRDERAEE